MVVRWRVGLAAAVFVVMPLLGPTASAADKTPAQSEKSIPPVDPAKRYAACMALARTKPTDGWESALAWIGEGGGEPARHCGAVALIGLKQYKEAALRLEDLAKSSHDDPELRAGMLAQAGQAWILDGDPARAYADQTTALQLTPDAPELLIDRAESLALNKSWKDALADLDRVLELVPNRADALTYRATAKRMLNDLGGAAQDVGRALELDPKLAEAWLEAGDIKRLAGDKKGAHTAWQQVVRLAPNSPAATAARENLERLDLKE